MKINLEGAWVTKSRIGFGVTLYVAFCREYPSPLGFVWGVEFGGKKPTFNVWDSYVVPWARRQGVRTLMNEEIFKANECIVTGAKSECGAAFMKARGYRHDERLDEWSLTRGDTQFGEPENTKL